MALDGVRSQHVRDVDRVRRIASDRDTGVACRADPSVGAGSRRAGRRRGARGAAWPVGGIPPQAAGDDYHGPDPVRGADERAGSVHAWLAQLRPIAVASVTSPRIAIAIAGVLLLATALLLAWHGEARQQEQQQVPMEA